MFSNRIALLISVLMVAASIGAVIAKPSVKVSDEAPIVLEKVIPHEFGDWREEPQRYQQVVNPQTQELLDKLYSQILSRTYVNSSGYRVMLSLAYGTDQRGSLKAHKPEVCYPAQGFTITKNEAGTISTSFGDISVRRLFSHLGSRNEPVTYWFTIGDQVAMGSTERKLVELRLGLTGRIPDGMLFRVSSIDANEPRAYEVQQQFVNELLLAVPTMERQRLSGLGGS